MSCFHPISIRNPKLVKDSLFDRQVLEVPCGHCVNCKDSRRLSWFIRLYYEWKYCIDNGGFALFETLTYNNDHLPKLVLFDKSYPCFNVRDIQLYLKRLRKYLDSHYKGYNIKFKYFLSMEYGGRTHRPHYHIVFFVSSGLIRPFDFKYKCEQLWHENGFTKSGSLNNGFVCGVGGLNYCAKYVCKDIYEEDFFRHLLLKFEKVGCTKEMLKPFFPHCMQSINLGIYALAYDKLNDYFDFMQGNIKLPDKNEEVKSYKLPLYYDRKLFFDVHYRYFDGLNYVVVDNLSDVPLHVDYSPIYVLNEEGLKMKDVRLISTLDAVSHVYRVVTSIPESFDIVDKINKKYEKSFENLASVQSFIKKSISEEVFVAYSLAYRGCCCVSDFDPPVSYRSNLLQDISLKNECCSGYRPLSLDLAAYKSNVDYYNSIFGIEDIYQIIRYIYYLVHISFERDKLFVELDYVNQKSVFLAHSEHYV